MPAAVRIVWEPINRQQDEFVASAAEKVLFSGAFGAGKSIALCAKALRLSLDHPKNFGYVCRKVRATIGLSTLKTFLDLICPKELIADYNKSEGLITLTNGSQLLFGGLDDPLKLGSLGAGGIGFVAIDEAIETVEGDWRMLEGRLRLPNVPHQIFAATNPGPPSHYLHRIFFQEHRGEVYQASALDNPALPDDYKARLQEFEGIYRDRYVLGLWKGLEGLVYSAFDDKVCLIPRFEVDKRWPIHTGHDFGLANTCALFYAESPGTGDFYAFAEYLPGAKLSIYEHVQAYKALTDGRPVIKRVGGNHQEQEIRDGYTQQGWPITEPKHSQDKAFQIKQVQGMHRRNKIYIFNDLKDYVREKMSFIFKPGTDLIQDESKFHCMSAERYLLSDFTPETAVVHSGWTRKTSYF
ncbi:MAG: phage terminase large subunit [Dehalococcoidia bacterium]|jgi:PBSX family phage terminase large subunit